MYKSVLLNLKLFIKKLYNKLYIKAIDVHKGNTNLKSNIQHLTLKPSDRVSLDYLIYPTVCKMFIVIFQGRYKKKKNTTKIIADYSLLV